jgi:hypothetical protein
LRLLRRERELHEERLAAFRREVMIGAAQAERGEFSALDIEAIAASVRAGNRDGG